MGSTPRSRSGILSLMSTSLLVRPLQVLVLLLLLPISLTLAQQQQQKFASMPGTPQPPRHPQLNGRHFRITTIEQPGYVDIRQEEGGNRSYSGYLIEILRAISREDRGNFTYELLPPSGFGSDCIGRLSLFDDNGTITTTLHHPEAYGDKYYSQYKCGESDVNDRPLSAYSTDMYWGFYYITTQRLAVNHFTVPINPPKIGTLGMMGTATGIRSIEELATNYSHMPVCAYAGTAYIEQLMVSFPMLKVTPITQKTTLEFLSNGTCEIVINAYAHLQSHVKQYAKSGQCFINDKPIGVIGDPLGYGLNHFAFGVRPDLSDDVLTTINYWMNALESCYPDDPTSLCSKQNGGGSFSELFESVGGTGSECGYVLFPPPATKEPLHPGIIAVIVISPLVVCLSLAMMYHMHQLKAQEKRMKKRFIQQLARNIEIGQSAHEISADKLTEAFNHIGGDDGMISKQDLARWLNDLHMDFMSEQDFDRLWQTLDMEGRGVCDAIDFITFLSQCGPQFKEVYNDYSKMPKTEKMKLAARRLSNISELGEQGVANMERRNNRRSRQMAPLTASLNTQPNSGFTAISELDLESPE